MLLIFSKVLNQTQMREISGYSADTDILLTCDACYSLLQYPELVERCWAIKSDCEARNIPLTRKCIDYQKWVELTLKHKTSMSL